MHEPCRPGIGLNGHHVFRTRHRRDCRHFATALLIGCALITARAVHGYDVGYIAGQFAVDPTGAATYRVPIQVPPGVHALRPELALLYNSRAGNGQLGMGWSLADLSAITRCPRTRAQDGAPGGVHFDVDDRFCLDGQRLVKIAGGRYGSTGNYRTEIESFQDVQAQASAGSGPGQFTVRDKSGLRREYGASTDSRPLAANGAARMWLLSQITDRYGNFIRYRYDHAAGEATVAEITYGNSRGAVLARVTFSYQNRPDRLSSYVAGEEFGANQRLAQISTYAAGSRVKTYTLGYAQGRASGRSQLASITECDANNNCLAPLSFGWQQNIPGFSPTSEASPLPASMSHLQIGDFDGDGIPDYLYVNSSAWYMRLGKNPAVAINTGLRVQNGDQPEYSLVADMNADGCTDLVTANISRGWYVWHSNCNGAFRAAQQGNRPAYNAQDQQPLLADLNGDGYPELVFKYTQGSANNSVLAYYLNGPSGLAPNVAVTGLIASRGQKLIPINFFGNGTIDFYLTRADDCNDANRGSANAGNRRPFPVSTRTGSCAETEGVLTWNGNTLAHADLPATDMAYAKDPVFLDLNGDGLTDILSPECFPRCQWQVYVNRGGSWPWQSAALAPASGPVNEEVMRYARAVDYNGDGLSDLMYPDSDGRWSVLLSNGKALGPRQETGLPTAGYASTQFLDYRGNGWADMLYLDRRWQLRTRGIGIMPDLMQRISQGAGSETFVQHSISYLPLSDIVWRPIVYSGHSGSVTASATRHFLGPLYVVRSFASHAGYDRSGNPSYVNSYYRYAGAKLDLQGRGFLGFASVEAANTNTSIVTRAVYRQEFPFTGMVAQTLQFVSNQAPTGLVATDTQGAKICRLPNGEQDLCPEPPPQAANSILDNPPGRLVTRTDNEFAADVIPLGTSGESRFAYPRSSRQQDYDLVTGALYRETTTRYSYDTHGNPTSVQTRTVNAAGTEALDVQVTNNHAHDNVGSWCLGLQSSSRTVRTFNNMQQVSERSAEHDPNTCELVAEIAEPKNPTLELTQRYSFDAFGNRVATALSGANIVARTSSIEFDTQGQFPIRIINALRQVSSQSWEPAFGNQLSSRTPNGVLTRREYDGFGRLIREAGPNPGQERRWSRSWCARNCRRADAGYKIVVSGADGSRAETEYDALGRATFNARLGPEINGSARVVAEETHYDPLGRAYLISRPYFEGATARCWEFRQYDNLNRLTRELQPAGANECATGVPTLDSPPAYGRVTQYAYNGAQTTQTDALGRSTTRMDNVIGKPGSVTDADGHSTYYAYDPLGNPTRITDANGNVTRMAYDPAGRKIEMWDPDMGHWTYAYDALGQLIRQTDAKGQTLAQTWDALDRLIQRQEPEGVTRWVYDIADGAGLGQLAYVARDDGYWEGYAYDNYGAPTDKLTIIDNHEYWITTSYDRFGRVDSVAYPDINVPSVKASPSGLPPALRMPASSSGKFDIDWDVARDGAIYHLYRAPDAGMSSAPPSGAREVYSGSKGIHHENLSEPGSYRYWLTLCHAQNCSPTYSTAAIAIERPTAPGNFQVRADNGGGDGRYTASWNGVAGATAYKLFHSNNAEDLGSEISGGNALAQALMLDDGDHYYQLQACAASGCGPFVRANAIHVMRNPGAPTLSAPANSVSGRYDVSWSAPADTAHVKYYQLQEAVKPDFVAATTSVENASTSSRAIDHPVSDSATYYYRIQACNRDDTGSACGAYSETRPVSILARPGDPVNFSMPRSSNNGNFRISWEKGTGGAPENYIVSPVVDVCEYDYESRKNICSRLPAGPSVTVSVPYVEINVPKDGTYQYVVQACNASGCSGSAYAGAVVVRIIAGIPANLRASTGTSSDGTYQLTWSAASGSPDYYELFEATGADFGNQQSIFKGAQLSKEITGKSPNGTYWYRLRACNGAGCGDYTNAVAVRVAVIPGPPAALSASTSNSKDGNYRLTWGVASGSPRYYDLMEASAEDFSNAARIYNGDGTTWPISGKAPNGDYYYRARACNETGCGPFGNAVLVKVAVPPATPVNVSMPASSNTGNFRIAWSAGAGTSPTSYSIVGSVDHCEYDYETRRNICWRLPGGGSYTVSTPYVDITGLSEGLYYYSVSACDSSGCSPAIGAGGIRVTLPPAAPANIAVSPASTTTGIYTVSWSSASGSPTSYQLFETFNTSSNGETQIWGGTALSWIAGGRNTNGTYYYRARACNAAGCGPYTNSVAVRVEVTLLPPEGSNCPPRVRVCQIMQPDLLVLAKPSTGTASPVNTASPAQVAVRRAPGIDSIENSNTNGRDSKSDTAPRPSALGQQRWRYARAASVFADKNAYVEYSRLLAAHAPEATRGTASRQGSRFKRHSLEASEAYLPQLEFAASSKPSGAYTHVVQYGYDKTGHLSQVTEIPPDGAPEIRLWALADTDAVGHITGEVFGNGLARARDYDAATGLLIGVNSGVRDTTLQDETYEWNSVGSLRVRRDGITGLVESFDYDRLERLTRVRTAAPNVNAEASASYDAIGNIQSRDGIGRYAYGGSPYAHTQPHAVRELTASDGTPRKYKYDANGNLTSGPGRVITWTSYNKPKSVNDTRFAYAPDGNLISRSGPNGSNVFIGRLFEVAAASAGVTEYKMYVYAGDELVAIHTRTGDGKASTHYPLQDHLGSAVLLTDQQAREVPESRIGYDAWGKLRPAAGALAYRTAVTGQSTSAPGRPLGFTGHLNLDDLGLIHMGGRLYDPELGRMMSADPNVQFPFSSQGFNRYSYVNNNPLSFTDPSGYSILGDVLDFVEETDLGRSIKYSLFRQMSPEAAGALITVGSFFCGPWAPACAAAGTYDYSRANGVPSERAIRYAGAAAVMSFATSAASDMAAVGNYGEAAITAYGSGYAAGRLSGGDAALSGRIALLQLGLKVAMDKYVQSHNPATPDYSSTADPAETGAVVKAEGVGVQDAQASNAGKSIIAPKNIPETSAMIGKPLNQLSQSDLALLKPFNPQIIEVGGRLRFSWQSEGSGFMQFASQRIGGVNAFSVFHDVWMQHWGIAGGFFISTTIPIAVYLQYGALGAWSQNYILRTAD